MVDLAGSRELCLALLARCLTLQDQDVAPTAPCSCLLVQEPWLLGPLRLGGVGNALSLVLHCSLPYGTSDQKSFSETSSGETTLY